jgi:hypothetical protein
MKTVLVYQVDFHSTKYLMVVFLTGKDASNLTWFDSQSEFVICLLKSSTYFWLFSSRRQNNINFKNSIIYDYEIQIENWNYHEFLLLMVLLHTGELLTFSLFKSKPTFPNIKKDFKKIDFRCFRKSECVGGIFSTTEGTNCDCPSIQF